MKIIRLPIALTIACALAPTITAAQETCFGGCRQAFAQSSLPFPDRADAVQQSLVGCEAPDFYVRTIDGKFLRLSELRGKVVVLNFWFTSCAPCVAELPALNRLQAEYRDKDVVFIAFSRDDQSAIRDFLKRKPFAYHIVPVEFDTSDKYCGFGWPMNMVIDGNGILRQVFAGGRTDEKAETEAFDKMKPVIDQYLKP